MIATSHVQSEIRRALGECVLPPDEATKHEMAGETLLLVVQPETEQQVSEVVKLCRNGDVIVVAVGVQQQVLDIRRDHDDRPIVLVSTKKLNQVVEYSPDDLTIIVQTGMPLAELQRITSKHGQFLPLDPPCRETATVGGALVTNASGPRRFLHRTISDYLLGASMVLADGSLIKSGAKTVKSVAGYDLHKLFIGSHGSLGIVTQVSLKLKPIPEQLRMVELRVPDAPAAEAVITQIIRGSTRPAMLDLINSRAAGDLGQDLASNELLICVGYEDLGETVEWQLNQLKADFGDRARLLDEQGSLEQYQCIVEWPAQDCDYSFEAVLPGRKCEAFVEFCIEHDIAAVARAGNGIVLGRGRGELAAAFADSLRKQVGPDGSLKFIKLPPDSPVSRWGQANPARRWMRAIKNKFDPHGVFPFPGFLGR